MKTESETKPKTDTKTQQPKKNTPVRTALKAGGRGGLIYPGEL